MDFRERSTNGRDGEDFLFRLSLRHSASDLTISSFALSIVDVVRSLWFRGRLNSHLGSDCACSIHVFSRSSTRNRDRT
jgi:hypothetical protein